MNAKKQKLEKQAPLVDIQSSIFKGISVFVNGYTGMQVFCDDKVAMTFHYCTLCCVTLPESTF